MDALRDILPSVGLHAAIVLIAVANMLPSMRPPREVEPIFFDVVQEEASEAETPVPKAETPAPPVPSPPPGPAPKAETPTPPSPPPGPAPQAEVPVPALPSPPPMPAPKAETPAPPSPPPGSAPQAEVPVPALPPAPPERARTVTPPGVQGRIVPLYPRVARRKGREGRVVVEVRVSAWGGVEAVRVVESSGFRELDEAAVEAVKGAVFRPARLGADAVAGEIRLPFEFRLK